MFSTPSGTPASRASSPNSDADAGVCSDGFTTAALPQKIAGNAFQATFGSGVLKLMISAATPSGWRTVSTVRCGMLAVVVRPYERRPSPATNRPISTAASVSPSASSSGFPVSSATIADASSRRSRRRRASSRQTSPRATGVSSAHAGCAARAALTATSTSSRPERATRQRREPSAGRNLSSHAAGHGRHRLPADEVVNLVRHYQADQPPSTTTFEPVTYDDASDARKTTAPSASSAFEHPPHGRARCERLEELGILVVPDPRERERVHAHPLLRPVRREIAREIQDRGLRDRVRNRLEEHLAASATELVEVLHRGEQAVDGRDVDDRAAASPGHRPADHLAGEERSLDVHVHDRVERGLREVLEGADLLDRRVGRRVERGVVHEQVRDAPLGLDLAHGSLDRRPVRDVHVEGARALGHLVRGRRRELATRIPRSARPAT